MITEKNYQRRKRAVKAALGSVKLEYPDIEPSKETEDLLNDWCYGQITTEELRKKVVDNIKDRLKIPKED